MSDELGIGDFDARNYDTETQGGRFKPVPAGIYQLEVKEAEVTDNAKKNGRLLKGKIAILAPQEYAGKWFGFSFNLNNPNATAEKIGREDLAKLSRAIGMPTPRRASELMFKRFTAEVEIEEPEAGSKYGPKNNIKTYFYPDKGDIPAPKVEPTGEATPATPTPANANTAPAASAGNAASPPSRPWG